MTQKRLKGRFLIKAKTAQEFATENPLLLKNELVIEKDTGKKKLGDGTNQYNNLSYLESIDWNEISNKPVEFTPKTHTHLYAGSSTAGGAAAKAIADGDGNTIASTYAKISTIPTKVSQLTNDAGYLTTHQSLDDYAKITLVNAELAKKADVSTVVRTDRANILTSSDTDFISRADTDSGLTLRAAPFGKGACLDLCGNDVTGTYSGLWQLSACNSSATYNLRGGKDGSLTFRGNHIARSVNSVTADANGNVEISIPSKVSELTNDKGYLTAHQDLSNYVTLDGTQTISGDKTFSGFCSFTGQHLLLNKNTVLTWYSGSPNTIIGTFSYAYFSGEAASAKKLTADTGSVDVGDESTPVYFKSGVPVACTATNSMPVNKDSSSTTEFGYEIINNNLFLLSSTEDGAEVATLNANIPWSNIQDVPQIFSVVYPEYTTGLYRFCTNKYGQVTGAVAATGDDISALNPTAAKVTATADSTNYTGYIPFVSGTGAQAIKTNTNLTFNPYTGTLSATKVLNAVYNDYAEFFPRGEETEAGDIVALDLNSEQEQYIKATENSIVAGVHSDEYAHLIGGEIAPENEDFVSYNMKKYIPVSLAGRVSVKVKGKVERGDYIVASDEPGIGTASKDPVNRRAIVGYAVEASDNEEIKRIRVRVKGD